MIDLKLNADHDLDFQDGDLVLIEGHELVAQSVKNALLTGLGEWAFDLEFGTAYMGGWRARPYSTTLIDADVRRVCLSVPGVLSVEAVQIEVNDLTRHLTCSVEIVTSDGSETIDIEV